jgi:hypothetical protein
LNSVDPQLESAWFRTLILKCDVLVSNFAFKFNLYRYITGAASNGFTVNEMEKNHGVDLNRMNAELVRAVNSGGKGVVVTATRHAGMQTYFGSDALVLRVAVGGGGGSNGGEGGGGDGIFSNGAWDEVRRACTAVLQRHIAHIPKCRCGF